MKMLLTLRELESLTADHEGPALSLYLTTVTAGPEVRQNRIRFKNLVSEAEERLKQEGLRAPEAREFVRPLRRYEADDIFWLHQQAGLAVFKTRDFDRLYRLPLPFPELVVTGTRFHIKPLFRLLQDDGHFFLLALELNGVRLFQGSRYQLEELDVPDAPDGMRDVGKPDTPQQHLQKAVQSPPNRGALRAGSSQPPITFGMGEEVGERREGLLQYFHAVDRALREPLRGETAPLLLAGLGHLLPLFREASTYPHLVEESLVIDPAALATDELHRQAWERVAPLFSQERERRAELYRQAAGTDRVASSLAVVLPAAVDKRIDTLWVAEDGSVWGRFDRAARRVEEHAERRPGDEDLLNAAAALTLLGGGSVYVEERVKLPGPAGCAALLRW